MQHLRRADPVDDPDSGHIAKRLEGGARQRFARGNALAQPRKVVVSGHLRHRAVGGGGGEADGGAVIRDSLQQIGRRGLFEQERSGPDPHREEQQPTETEGEGDRWRAAEDVVARGAEDVGNEAVAGGEHVAVEVHRSLGLAGGAGGEGDHCHIVRGGLDIGELGRFCSHHPVE